MKNISIPIVSDYETRKKWEVVAWQKFIKQIADLSPVELQELFSIISTPNERKNILMRTAAVDRVNQGGSYRQIGRELWLAPQTVSAIRRAMKEKNYLSYNERGKTERKHFTKESPLPNREPNPNYGKRKVHIKGGSTYVDW